jgi:hypothetical protein
MNQTSDNHGFQTHAANPEATDDPVAKLVRGYPPYLFRTRLFPALLSAPFSDAVEYYFNTVKQFCSLQQRSLPINDYANQATEIFAVCDRDEMHL